MSLLRYVPSRNFIFYSIIGISGVALDYAIYAILIQWLDWQYLVASVVSTSAGITNNFLWNCFLNFQVKDRLLKRFATFYGVGLLGLIVASVLLYAQVEWLGVAPLIGKLTTIIVVILLQYNLNRRYSFRKASVGTDASPTYDRIP